MSRKRRTPKPAHSTPTRSAASRWWWVCLAVVVSCLFVALRVFVNTPNPPQTDGSVTIDNVADADAALSPGVPLSDSERTRLDEAKSVVRIVLGADHPVARQMDTVSVMRHRQTVYLRVQGKPAPIYGTTTLDPTEVLISPLILRGQKSARLCATLVVEMEHTINPDFKAWNALPPGKIDNDLRRRMEATAARLALKFLDELEALPQFTEWKADIPDARMELKNFLSAVDDGWIDEGSKSRPKGGR